MEEFSNMSDAERLVKFRLLNQDFAFYTGASEAEMEAILDLVRRLVEENGGQSGGTLPVSKVAVMACLNLASRYIRLKDEFDEYRENNEAKLEGLNARLGQLLALEK